MSPGECKLLPRHPGYVMTVCDETREKRLERHAATMKLGRQQEQQKGEWMLLTSNEWRGVGGEWITAPVPSSMHAEVCLAGGCRQGAAAG
ncbi:MAG: hypothetical protein Q9210_005533 [Variospora velana]